MALGLQGSLVAPLCTPGLLTLSCFAHITSAPKWTPSYLPLKPDLVEEKEIESFYPSIGLKLKEQGARGGGHRAGALMGKKNELWVCSVPPPTHSRSQQVLYLAPTSALNGCGAVHLVSGLGGRGMLSRL